LGVGDSQEKASPFNRKEGNWERLEVKDGVIDFKLGWGGGELLRLE